MEIKKFELPTINKLDLGFDPVDFDFPEIEIAGFESTFEKSTIDTGWTKIKRYMRPRMVRYEKARDMVRNLPKIEKDAAIYAVVSGNFIFGDFLEALMVEKNIKAKKMYVATLSLGPENAASLTTLLEGGYCDHLALLVSDYWYAHEKHGAVKFIQKHMGQFPQFQFAAAGLHTKITCIQTVTDRFLVMHGSANLRSSRNLEQFCLEENEDFYRFNVEWMETICRHFTTTNRSARAGKLWQAIDTKAPPDQANPRAWANG